MGSRFALGLTLALAVLACSVAASAPPPPTPKPTPTMRPLDRDPAYTAVAPLPGDGTGTESNVILAPISSSRGTLTGTVLPADEQPGPKALYVGTVDAQGNHKFYKTVTDAAGRFKLKLPTVAGGLAALVAFRHFKKDGQPDEGARCQIVDGDTHLADTQPLAHVPANGPAILEANSAYERGGLGQGLMQMQVRGIDPLRSRILADGSAHDVDTLATADRSIVGKLHDDAPLTKRHIEIESAGKKIGGFDANVVTENFDQLQPLRPGSVQPVNLHVNGLKTQDAAIVIFSVSGAAMLDSGAPSVTVPVKNGVATTNIRATHPGQLFVRARVEVQSDQFAQEGQSQPSVLPTTTSRPPTPSPEPSPKKPTPKPSASGAHTTGREASPPPVTEGRSPPPPPESPPPSNPPSIPPPSYPPSARPSPSPSPTCDIKYDGFFEPTQAVWQDDRTFFQKPVPIIKRMSKDSPDYDAELNMVANKPAVLFGVDFYLKSDSPGLPGSARQYVQPKSRETIQITVYTNCTVKHPVWMKFTGVGTTPSQIYTSPVLDRIPLDGPPGSYQTYVVKLHSPIGIPPDRTFTFGPNQGYRIEDELISDLGPTGLKVTVIGYSERTLGPMLRYVPVWVTGTPTQQNRLALRARAISIAADARYYIPDFYPLRPKDMPSVVRETFDLSNVDISPDFGDKFKAWAADLLGAATPADIDAKRQQIQTQKLAAALIDALSTSGFVDGAGRTIAIMAYDDYYKVAPLNSLGITVTTKVILIPEFMNYQTVAHELAHSIPAASWSSADMLAECELDYHNTQNLVAMGEQITTASFIGPRKRKDGTFPIMGASGVGEFVETKVRIPGPLPRGRLTGSETPDPRKWITECTYWHLLKNLEGPLDPKVTLVRGFLYRRAGHAEAAFNSFYDLDGTVDVKPGAPAPYGINVLDASGKPLAAYAVTPLFRLPDTTTDRNLIPFAYRIPTMERAAKIQFVGPGGVLAERDVSGNPPKVTIVAPAANAKLVPRTGGTVRVSWNASARAGSRVLSSALYSTDGGLTFADQLFEKTASSYDVALTPGVKKHVVKVVVTDGAHSASALVKFSTK